MDFEITKRLIGLKDAEYAAFQAKLTPGIPERSFIGVRVPVLRKLAKEYLRDQEAARFLETLPHEFFDENMLHSLLLSETKDFDECVKRVDEFLPHVDNWAVCDVMSPKIFGKHTAELLPKAKEWIRSKHAYTCRFGMEMLMTHYLDANFEPGLLKLPARVRSDEYYVKMMIAWFFATALTKRWDDAIPYIENGVLDVWTHNKTIQKARESFRIPADRKELLRSLKKAPAPRA